jgi:uncharacterized protein (DUF58 family)
MWWKFRRRETTEGSKPSTSAESHELREAGRAPLSEIAKKVKKIEIAIRRKSSQQLSGDYKSRFRGQGVQFADFRPYQYGDDIRHIDWRTSARQQHPVIKTFEEERELTVLFAVDISGSAGFGTQGKSKREAISLALAAVALAAAANNDRVGLLLFTDRIERYVPPKKGRKHALRIVEELLSYQPIGKQTDLSAPLTHISHVLRQGSVVLFASDFFGKLDTKRLKTLARKHDLVMMQMNDPRDYEIPSMGLVRLEDPETGESLVVDTSSNKFRRTFTESQRRRLATTAASIRNTGASHLEINTSQDPMEAIRGFFYRRKRRGR